MTRLQGFQHEAAVLPATAQRALYVEIQRIVDEAPFFTPTMPRTGKPLSVRMTNCGPLGWLTYKAGGYRYQAVHPETAMPWPAIPAQLLKLWHRFVPECPPPEACLINWYAPDAKLGLHRDADEVDQTTPVLSVSLGDDAWFRIGGLKRRDPTERLLVRSGDVIVLGGASRCAYHGIDRILPGTGTLLDEPGRINLTLRRVSLPV